jgi:hypothetical protein
MEASPPPGARLCPDCGFAAAYEKRAANRPGCEICRSFLEKWYQREIVDSEGRLFHERRRGHPTAWINAAITLLAPRLADRLDRGETVPPAPPLTAKPALREICETHELITTTAWNKCMALIASGALVDANRPFRTTKGALFQADILPGVFRRYLRAEPRLSRRFAVAKAARKRRRWPTVTPLELIDEISRGDQSFKAIAFARGFTPSQYQMLLVTIWRDPALREAYLAAKQGQQFALHAQIRDTAAEALDKVTSRAEMRKITKTANQALMPLLRLQPARLRRAAAQEYYRQRSLEDPLWGARRRAKQRGKGAPAKPNKKENLT